MKKGKKRLPLILSDEQYYWLKKTSQTRMQSMVAIIRELINKEAKDERIRL